MIKLQNLYIFFQRLSKKERLFLYLALGVVSLMVVDRLVISPVAYKMKSLDKEIEDTETGIKNAMRLLAQKDKIVAESNKYNSFLSAARSEEEETTSFLKDIENLASQTSMYLVDMKPAAVKEAGESRKFLVNVNGEAQMEQLLNFMYAVENSDKMLRIEKFEISPKSKESSIAKCAITVSKIVSN